MSGVTTRETTRDVLGRPLPLPGGAVLRNRLAKAAMSEQLAGPDHAPTDGLVRLYERWGAGGAGLLITGNVMVDGRALGEPGNVVVEDRRDRATLERWAAAGRAGGAELWMQVNHPGRQQPRFASAGTPVAPSAVPLEGMGGAFKTPRALLDAEVREIIARFAATAAIAKEAGFSGVQVHAAHGYLASQFLSPRTNRRDDAWGGTPERRRRFLLEVVRAIRAAVGPRFGLGVKLNSADFQRGGFAEDESMDVIRALGGEGVDLLEISGGTYERPAMWQDRPPEAASTRAREAYFLEYAEKVRALAAMPLMLTGGLRTAAGMRAAVEGGAIDVVGLARPLAVEPDLPARLLAGGTDGARPIRLALGLRKLDSIVEAGWYQWQIRRMARGLAPAPGASRLAAFGTVIRSLAPRCA